MKAAPIRALVASGMLVGAVAVWAQDPAATPQPPAKKRVIFVCGDSTAKNSGNGKTGAPLAGWGTPLANFFDTSKVTVSNVGHAGTSSMTYYNGDWPNVLPRIGKGDYVLIVFGINDGGRMTPDGIGDETRTVMGQVAHTYGWYMSRMATDSQAKGAKPIYLTVTTRNIWTNPNPKVKFNDATPIGMLPADYDPKQDRIERGTGGAKYTRWTKEVGEKLHIPVFDLTNYCADQYEKMGREEVNKFYNDHNHTYLTGAEYVAGCIVSGLKGLKDSPFIELLSEKGRALPTAEAKFVSDNLPPAMEMMMTPAPAVPAPAAP